MPPHARVFIIEDSETLSDSIGLNLELADHTVVGTARTIDDAIEAVGRFGELAVQVVTLDGDLRSGEAGRDGEIILEAIREQAPEVKTIGLSGAEMPGVDLDVTKARVIKEGMSVLSQAITDL